MLVVAPEHEPWADEAQAWLLARDAPLWDLFWKYARYEGTPILWHLLLVPLAKGGLPYFTLTLLSILLATTTAAIIFRSYPGPAILRFTIPFSYFLVYQYAIVARSYVLFALLLFTLLACWPRRQEKRWIVILLLVLLSQTCVHGMILSGTLFLFLLGEAFAAWRADVRTPARLDWSQWGLLFANYVLLVAQLWPPADIWVRGLMPLGIASRVMDLALREAGSQNGWLTYPFFIPILILCCVRRVAFLTLFGTTVLVLFLGFRYFGFWHAGIVTLWLFFCLGVALHQPEEAGRKLPGFFSPKRLTWAGVLGALVIVGVQTSDGARALLADYESPYSGSREAASYIQQRNLQQTKIHAYDINSFAVLPYFSEGNFFANFRDITPGFWVWSREFANRTEARSVVAGAPDYILVGIKPKTRRDFGEQLQIPGYIAEKTFLGELIWKGSTCETDHLVLYRRQ